MDNHQIHNILSSHPWTRTSFVGVYPSDKLPMQKKNGIYIINTDKQSESGTHWLLIRKWSGRTVYLDPFGLQPLEGDVKEWLKGQKVEISIKCIQSPSSTLCGVHCVNTAILLEYMSLQEILNYFSTELLSNDFLSLMILSRLLVIKTRSNIKHVDRNKVRNIHLN